MKKHHKDSIEIFLSKYTKDGTILALLLAGSIAHGFAKPESDIDIIIIVDKKEYQKRKKEKKLAFSLWDICTYDGGYIDCKVISIAFLKLVVEKGSDPARYAFKDNVVLFSRINNLDKILQKAVMFPVQEKDERRKRFISQLLAWK
jgi:predicted nucleotidyltransferase